ncbi:DUF2975 domain-containing protein [Thermodesulfobacteriota bacterium]
MQRIRRLSKILRGMCIVALVLLVPTQALMLMANLDDASGKPGRPSVEERLVGSDIMMKKALRIVVTAARTVLGMVGLYLLIRLFGLYSQGHVFSKEDVSALRRIAHFTLIWVPLDQLDHILKSPLPSAGSPIGASLQGLAFGIETTAAICFAVLVVLLSWVMDDRYRLFNGQQETNPERIRQVSSILRMLCLFALVMLPIFQIIYWNFAEYWRALHMDDFTGFWPTVADGWPLSATSKIVGSVSRIFPLAAIMIVLVFLIKLLGLVSRGDYFSAAGARCARVIGYTVIVDQILRPFYDCLTTVALALNAPPYIRAALVFSSDHLAHIALGLMLILLSRILSEGTRLKECPSERVESC